MAMPLQPMDTSALRLQELPPPDAQPTPLPPAYTTPPAYTPAPASPPDVDSTPAYTPAPDSTPATASTDPPPPIPAYTPARFDIDLELGPAPSPPPPPYEASQLKPDRPRRLWGISVKSTSVVTVLLLAAVGVTIAAAVMGVAGTGASGGDNNDG